MSKYLWDEWMDGRKGRKSYSKRKRERDRIQALAKQTLTISTAATIHTEDHLEPTTLIQTQMKLNPRK